MAYAICPKCDLVIEWSAGKGSKLSRLECPKCKGKLKAISRAEAFKPHRGYKNFKITQDELACLEI